MRSKKILWGLLVFFAFLALLIVVGNRLLVRPMALKAQKRLEGFVPDRQVRLGKASTNWFNAFTVSPVEISRLGGFVNGTAARAETVRLTYRLTDILLKRVRAEEGLASIQLIGPSVVFDPCEPWKFKSKGGGTVPPLEISWQDGTFQVKGASSTFEGLKLEAISGALDTSALSPTLEIFARTPQDNTFSFQADPATVTVKGSLEMSLKVSAPLAAILKKDWASFQTEGSVKLNGVSSVLTLRHKEKISANLAGSVIISNDKIEAGDLTLKTPQSDLICKGSISSIFGERNLEGNLSGRAGLDDLRKILGWRSKEENFTGGPELAISLSGTLKNPQIAAVVKFREAALYKMPISGESEVTYSSKTLEIQSASLKWGEGAVTAKGTFGHESIAYASQVRGLNLNPFFVRPWDPEKKALAGGRLNLFVSGSGPRKNSSTKGNLKITDFFWGNRAEERTTLTGKLEAVKNSLRITVRSSKNPMGLSFTAETLDGLTQFKNCRLSFSPGETLTFAGRIDHETEELLGELKTTPISTNRLAPLLGLFSNFSGKVSAAANIKGKLQAPSLSGTLRGRDLALKGTGEKIGTLSAYMEWAPESFSLSKIVLGNLAQGFFSYARKDRSMNITAALKGLNPKVIFALAGRPADIEGKAEGNLSLIRRNGADPAAGDIAWEGSGKIKVRKGRWGNIPFESLNLSYRTDKSSIFLEEFSFLQKGGSLIARGETSEDREKNPLKLTADLRNFQAGTSVMNGGFEAEGTYGIGEKTEWLEAQAKSKNFSFNKFSAGAMSGTIELKDKALALGGLRWGDFFRGEGRLTFGEKDSPKIEGEWKSSVKDMGEWSEILPLENLPIEGKMSLSGKVNGNFSNMRHSIESNFSEFKLKPRPGMAAPEESYPGFSGSGAAVLSGGVIKSLKVRASQGREGDLTVLGQIHLKSKELILDTLFSNIDSGIVFQGLGWRDLRGKMDGHLEVKGPWLDPVAKGEIKGGEGMLGKIPLDSWEVSGTFQEKELQFRRLNLRGRRDSWRFSVLEDSWIKPQEEKKRAKFRLVTDFANISLGPVFFVGSGTAEGEWKPKEGKDVLLFEGTAKMNELSANNVELKPFQVKARYSEKLLKLLPLEDSQTSVEGSVDLGAMPCVVLKGISVKEHRSEIFSADGEWCPDRPSFSMKGTGVDAAVISGILEMPFGLIGPSDFKIDGAMKGGEPSLSGNLALRGGRAEEIPLETLSANFSWRKGVFSLASLQAVSKNYFTLEARGSFPMKWGTIQASHQEVDLTAQCKNGNLSFLNLFGLEQVKDAKGSFTADLTLKGKAASPSLSGKVKVKKGEFDSKYLTRKVQDLDLDIGINKNRASFLNAKCGIGDGRLKMEGSVQAAFEGADFSVESYDLKLQTLGKKGIPIQIPQLPATKEKLGIPAAPSRAAAAFALALQGPSAKPKISGWAELEQALFSYPPPEKGKKERFRLERAVWDVLLRTGRQTIYQNDFAYARLNGKISFKGDTDDLTVSGRITSNEGTVTLFGSRFDLKEASLEIAPKQDFKIGNSTGGADFKNAVTLQFKAQKTAFVSSGQGEKIADTITLELQRTALTEAFDAKKVSFRSAQNPDLSSERVAGRAGLGQNLDALTPEERDQQLREGIARLLDSELASPIARSILGRFGIEKVEFGVEDTEKLRTPSLRGETPSSLDPFVGQSVLIEKTLFSRLGVGYKATLDRIQDQADLVHQIQLRYPFYKGIWLYGYRDLDSRENLGREPESKAGIQSTIRFDPSEWFKKKPPVEKSGGK